MAFYWTVLATGSFFFYDYQRERFGENIIQRRFCLYLKLILAIPQHSRVQARRKCLLSSEMYVMSDPIHSAAIITITACIVNTEGL